MSTPYDADIKAIIEDAFSNAEANKLDLAVQQFAFARAQALHLAHPAKLTAKIAAEHAAYTREREHYRGYFPMKENTDSHVLIMGDSLGLPRPDDKVGEKDGVERTYSGLIYDKYPDLSVTSICQRFFTTQNVRTMLEDDTELGRDAHFLLHVGLNDCAKRMFLENERISLSFLTVETRNRLIAFTRKYRRDIILRLPPSHYVSPEEFRDNLTVIISLLKARNVQKIILTTIILPPARSWPGTPNINHNFAKYNLEIMEVAERHGALLLDMDRHVWQAQNRGVLLADGMHLSDAGHKLFCVKADPYLR
jgi:lysophospholipase L1-like esterase